jgi:type IV pilus assembly protein PilN
MIRINLLAAERPVAKKKAAAAPGALQLYMFLALFGGAAVVVCGGLWYLKEAKLKDLDAQLAAAKQRQAELQTVAKQVEELEKRRRTFQDKVNLIETLKAKQSGPVHMLDELSKALPDFVWLNNLDQKGARLTLKGESATLTAVADFITALQQAGPECGKPDPANRTKCWFPDVNLVSSTASAENVVTFSLTATFRSLEEAAKQADAAAATANP